MAIIKETRMQVRSFQVESRIYATVVAVNDYGSLEFKCPLDRLPILGSDVVVTVATYE